MMQVHTIAFHYTVLNYIYSEYYLILEPPVYLHMYHLAGSNAVGSTLNITRINREHMGTYVCEANNGIPPSSKQNFVVQVHCKLRI